MKKIFLTLLICLGFSAGWVQAQEYSGTCGSDLQWTLQDGLLSITGSGAMGNYHYSSSYPWYQYRSQINTVTIGEDVTSIGDYAFQGCSSLEEVNFNARNCTSVGAYFSGSYTYPSHGAFYNLSSIKRLNIGEGVTTLPYAVFYGCSGISELVLPSSVTNIGGSAFYDCSGIGELILPSSVANLGEYAFRGCSGLTEITLSKKLTSIPSYCFYYCSNLKSITIPEDVTSIGQYAFQGCSSLEEVNFNARNCTSVGAYYSYGSSYYNYGAFYSLSSIKRLNIGDGVTTLPYAAFYDCSGIGELILPSSVANLGEYAFRGCSGLTEITLSKKLTSIPSYCFYYCSNLKSITIPEDVTSIGQYAFQGCSSLEEVNFNARNCTSVGAYYSYGSSYYNYGAFYNLSSIKRLNIGDGVTTLPYAAFYGCSGIRTITNVNKPQSIGSYTFYNLNKSNCKLYVPISMVGEYRKASYWSDFVDVEALAGEVIFNARNGDVFDTIVSYRGSAELERMPVVPVHPEGFYFAGWYEDSVNWTHAWDFGYDEFKKEETYLYAYWKEEQEQNSLSGINTDVVADITKTTALLGGEILGEGMVSACGVLVSTQATATLKTEDIKVFGGGMHKVGEFQVKAWELEMNTSYYAKAYAVLGKDTIYGKPMFFTTRSNNTNYTIEKISDETKTPSIVEMLVQVKDGMGKGANYLEMDDFEVWTDNEELTTSEIHTYMRKIDERPFAINTMLVLDYTASLNGGGRDGFAKVKAAATELVRSKSANQRFALIAFYRSRPDVLQAEFTDDVDLLVQKINSVEIPGTTTQLFAAYKEGLSYLEEDINTADYMSRNFMVVFTDGDDASWKSDAGPANLQEAVDARNVRGARVFTIGLNTGLEDLDQTPVLTALATTPSDYYSISDASELGKIFNQIQAEILREANSFYRLTYFSTYRENNHTLDLRMHDNPSSYVSASFSANGFESVRHGLYVGAYSMVGGRQTDAYGLRGSNLNLTNGAILDAVSYWADMAPKYRWTSSDTSVLRFETLDNDRMRVHFTGKAGSSTIKIMDMVNYKRVAVGLNRALPASEAGSFVKTYIVQSNGMMTEVDERLAVNFATSGGFPQPAVQQVAIGGYVSEPAVNPSRVGFEFAGWLYEGKLWDFGTPVESSITLTADWKEIPHISVTTIEPANITKDSATFAMKVMGETEGCSFGFFCSNTYGSHAANHIYPGIAKDNWTGKAHPTIDVDYVSGFKGIANGIYYVQAFAVKGQDTVFGNTLRLCLRSETPYYEITGYPPVATGKPAFVEVLFSVKDANGNGVDYLEDADFVMMQDSATVDKTSEFFRYVRKMDAIPFKMKTVLLLDNSASIGYSSIDALKKAAVELVKGKHEKQEFAIFTFAENAPMLTDFTADKDVLVQYISDIQVGQSTTNLYEAYIRAIEALPEDHVSKDSIVRTFLVLLSDGDETRHLYNSNLEAEAVRARNGKTVYAIGLGDELKTSRMEVLASSNRNYYPAANMSGLARVFQDIQYSIMQDANSFYNLVCLTNQVRNDNDQVRLQLTIDGNTNQNTDNNRYVTYFISEREMDDDIDYLGVYCNVYQYISGISIGTTNKYGLGLPDELTKKLATDTVDVLTLPNEFMFKAVTYGTYVKPQYVWTSSDTSAVEVVPIDFDHAKLLYKGPNPDLVVITVKDISNYQAVLNGEFNGVVTKDYLPFFQRSIRVKNQPPTPPTFNFTALSSARVGESYSYDCSANGTTPMTYKVDSGYLPLGLRYDADGFLRGTPLKMGDYTFKLSARNVAGSDIKTVSLNVLEGYGAEITESLRVSYITQSSVSVYKINTLYNGQEAEYAIAETMLNGGWVWQDDTVFVGLKRNTEYVIAYRAKATDEYAAGSIKYLSVETREDDRPYITTTVLPDAWYISVGNGYGGQYSCELQATGDPEYWYVADGTLPSGIRLSEDGWLIGTPYQTGEYTFTIGVVNAFELSDERQFTLKVRPGMPVPMLCGFESEGSDYVFWYTNNNTNYWRQGTATSKEGERSAYITYDGSTYGYRTGYSSISHIYFYVYFTPSTSPYNLSFDWKGLGETGYDYMAVYVVDEDISVDGGSVDNLGTSYGSFCGSDIWEKANIVLPAEYSGKTMKLVFTWRNDGSDGYQPPAAIDNIFIDFSEAQVTGIALNKTRAELPIGNTLWLSAEVYPAEANQSVVWSTSDSRVATVDETGLVTAVSEGEAIITATTVQNGYTASCKITVLENAEYDVVAQPRFSPASGTVEKGTVVTISCATAGAEIYYTTNGSTPTASSSRYTDGIIVDHNMTIKAIAMKDGWINSEVATARYTIEETYDVVAQPRFSPASGTVEKGTVVTISCATAGAEIYYTTNGSTPTASSSRYTDGIIVDHNMTIKAIAMKDGWINSEMATARYTIEETSNDLQTESVLKVYPNPCRDVLHFETNVNTAVIQIVDMVGRLCKQVDASLRQIDMSNLPAGIYTLVVEDEKGGVYRKKVMKQ